METSVLKSIKKILGLAPDYTAFDEDIILYINSALADLALLGVGPDTGVTVEDDTYLWSSLGLPIKQLGLAKSWIGLKVRMLFDPPTTSYLIASMEKQLEELAWKLNVLREYALEGEVIT